MFVSLTLVAPLASQVLTVFVSSGGRTLPQRYSGPPGAGPQQRVLCRPGLVHVSRS